MTQQLASITDAELSEQTANQYKAVIHMARSLLIVHEQTLPLIHGQSRGIMELQFVRSAEIMEMLGDTLNSMDAVDEDKDAWMDQVFEVRNAWIALLGENVSEFVARAADNKVTEQTDRTMSGQGITPSERSTVEALADAWNLFMRLDGTCYEDQTNFRQSINRAQDLIALRVARRVDPDLWAAPPLSERSTSNGQDALGEANSAALAIVNN